MAFETIVIIALIDLFGVGVGVYTFFRLCEWKNKKRGWEFLNCYSQDEGKTKISRWRNRETREIMEIKEESSI